MLEQYRKPLTWTMCILSLSFLLASCSSESTSESVSDSTQDSTTQSSTGSESIFSGPSATPDNYGYLLDSAVEGIRYISGDHHGVTDPDGRFGYMNGENIKFYIGNSLLGIVDTPQEQLTPNEFSGDSPFGTYDALRILQSLDNDGDPSNGIQITQDIHELAEETPLNPLPWDFSTPPWEWDYIDTDTILALTRNTAAGSRNTITAYDAAWHFSETLDELIDAKEAEIQSLADNSSCTSDNQCDYTDLESKSIYRCTYGNSIIYSEADIDQTLLDSKIAEREELINEKKSILNGVGSVDNSTGVCLSHPPLNFFVCNESNRCVRDD